MCGWCDAKTDRTLLSSASPEACPFIDRPGAQAAQVLRARGARPPLHPASIGFWAEPLGSHAEW